MEFTRSPVTYSRYAAQTGLPPLMTRGDKANQSAELAGRSPTSPSSDGRITILQGELRRNEDLSAQGQVGRNAVLAGNGLGGEEGPPSWQLRAFPPMSRASQAHPYEANLSAAVRNGATLYSRADDLRAAHLFTNTNAGPDHSQSLLRGQELHGADAHGIIQKKALEMALGPTEASRFLADLERLQQVYPTAYLGDFFFQQLFDLNSTKHGGVQPPNAYRIGAPMGLQ